MLEIREIDDHAAGGQVVRERRGRAEEERQPGFDAGGHLPRGHGAIDAALLRVAFEALAPAPAKFGDGLRRGGCLARRQERHGGEALAGALVCGIENAHRFDQVVEQVESKRLLRARREQVHDRSANSKLAGAQDLGDLRIAGVGQPLAEPRQVDPFAERKRKGMRLDETCAAAADRAGRPRVVTTMPWRSSGSAASVRSRSETMSGCGENGS